SAVAIRATDVFPLVPVRCSTGYCSCGEPSSSTIAAMRSSVGFVLRRDAPAGTPSDSRFTWASSHASASDAVFVSGRKFDLDRERLRSLTLEGLDVSRLADIVERRPQRVESLGVVTHDDPADRSAHRLLRRRLGLADLTEDLGRDGIDQRIPVRRGGTELLAGGPGGSMHRAVLPPRP